MYNSSIIISIRRNKKKIIILPIRINCHANESNSVQSKQEPRKKCVWIVHVQPLDWPVTVIERRIYNENARIGTDWRGRRTFKRAPKNWCEEKCVLCPPRLRTNKIYIFIFLYWCVIVANGIQVFRLWELWHIGNWWKMATGGGGTGANRSIQRFSCSRCCSDLFNYLLRLRVSPEELDQRYKSREIDKFLEKDKHAFRRQVRIRIWCSALCTNLAKRQHSSWQLNDFMVYHVCFLLKWESNKSMTIRIVRIYST